MPFERLSGPPRRIAVIGGGISGLAAAHLLAPHHRVTLVEGAPRLGGHARTVIAGRRGDQPVDTGFIVFNRATYPHLCRLFADLGVPVADSDMSFGASIAGGRFEYGLRDLRAVFAQKRNLADPRFLRMLRDVLHFNRHALAAAEGGQLTIAELLHRLGTGRWFRDYYITPLSGAIWSTPSRGILDFPAAALLRFFQNHALLSHTGQHQWYTVQGGSAAYVSRLERRLAERGVEIRTGCPVAAVQRDAFGAALRVQGGAWEHFDEVVLAVHSDQALGLLSDARPDERAALGLIRYQPNEMVLHRDASVMPRRRAAWASWVYTEPASGPRARIDLTYWMNSLQPIPQDDPLFVTLNGADRVKPELIYDSTVFHHPVYDSAALEGQARVRALNGSGHTWFCGAWMRNGFHEDGFASAVEVAEKIGRISRAGVAA